MIDHFSKENIHKGNLILVNSDYPIINLNENDLSPAVDKHPNILIKSDAANALKLLFEKIVVLNEIVPVSGFRTLEEQIDIFETSLAESGEEFTLQYVAHPQHSEHQTGLAIDLALNNGSIDFIRPNFPYTGKCNEFRDFAHSYGFIERYPLNKEKITGIAHEPWHFRYVGTPHAQLIKEFDFTLEEYIQWLKDFHINKKPYLYQADSQAYEISYLPIGDCNSDISINDRPYTISGNNIDGFILTVWR